MTQVVLVALACALVTSGGAASDAATSPIAGLQADVPGGEVALGSVRIGRRVLADGQVLAAGTYQVRLTAQQAQPAAAGATSALERWAEFVQGGQVKGREVVTIIPPDEVTDVAEKSPPAAGTARVELLKGDEYLRIWINRGGVSYLIHLPVA